MNNEQWRLSLRPGQMVGISWPRTKDRDRQSQSFLEIRRVTAVRPPQGDLRGQFDVGSVGTVFTDNGYLRNRPEYMDIGEMPDIVPLDDEFRARMRATDTVWHLDEISPFKIMNGSLGAERLEAMVALLYADEAQLKKVLEALDRPDAPREYAQLTVYLKSFKDGHPSGSTFTTTYIVDPNDWAITLRAAPMQTLRFDEETGRELHPAANLEWRIAPADLLQLKEAKRAAQAARR